jgi:hypothetical protein
MKSHSEIIVKKNDFPAVERKMVLGGRATVLQTLKEIAQDIERAAPYRGQTTTEVKDVGNAGTVEVNPWWIGFIEIGTVDRAARPFAGPAANRALEQFTPKIKAVGDKL